MDCICLERIEPTTGSQVVNSLLSDALATGDNYSTAPWQQRCRDVCNPLGRCTGCLSMASWEPRHLARLGAGSIAMLSTASRRRNQSDSHRFSDKFSHGLKGGSHVMPWVFTEVWAVRLEIPKLRVSASHAACSMQHEHVVSTVLNQL